MLHFLLSLILTSKATMEYDTGSFINTVLIAKNNRELFRHSLLCLNTEFDGKEEFAKTIPKIENEKPVSYIYSICDYDLLDHYSDDQLEDVVEKISGSEELLNALINSLKCQEKINENDIQRQYETIWNFIPNVPRVENRELQFLIIKITKFYKKIVEYFKSNQFYKYKGVDHDQKHIEMLLFQLIDHYRSKMKIEEVIVDKVLYTVVSVHANPPKYVSLNSSSFFNFKHCDRRMVCKALVKYRMIRRGYGEERAVKSLRRQLK